MGVCPGTSLSQGRIGERKGGREGRLEGRKVNIRSEAGFLDLKNALIMGKREHHISKSTKIFKCRIKYTSSRLHGTEKGH